MAVVDSLVVRKGSEFLPIDSYNDQTIDEIVYEGQSFHFAKQKDVTGTSEIVADNGVDEPIRSLSVSGATSQVLLPTEYQQVEYIESTGTQYIDTGFKPNQDTRVVAKFQALNTQAYFLCGTRETQVLNAFTICYYQNQIGCSYGNTGNVYVFSLDTNKHIVDLNKNVLKFDEATHTLPSKSFNCPSSLYLFACNQVGTATGYSQSRIYQLDIYDNGVLVRDYIPCYRKSDNVIGMYDLLNGVFYTNSGTGTFKKGANAPTPETPIPIQNANDNGMLLKLNDTYITIPKSITLNGENVPLLFSEYDKLNVDRVSNKVVYTQGSYTVSLTENSYFYLNPQGGINYYHWRVANSSNYILYSGYCSHFPRKPWWPIQSNYAYSITSGTGYTNIAFRTDGKQTLQEFKEYIKTIAPVYVIAQLRTPIEHNITNTDLGQSLLALATRKGTNYLEISSNLAPSQTDLSYWRQIIPNE